MSQDSEINGHVSAKLPYQILEDKDLGRHVVATRDMEVGEVVLEEMPLVMGPAQATEPVCLGCLNALQKGQIEECERCGWPVCSQKCAASKHHRAECDWTINKRGQKVKISNFGSSHPSYECITALRCLEKRRSDPKTWKKLTALESHCDLRKVTPRYDLDRRTIAGFLHRFFKVEQEYSEEEILKICGVLQINGHENPLTQPASVAVYERASLFEHSCHPNCGKRFTDDNSLVIQTVKKIKAGDHLSICYTDPLWGTLNRRHHLLETKFFLCKCPRCIDPTELGTYYSAVSCPNKECDWYVLLDTEKDDLNPETLNWICKKCNSTRTTANAQSVVQRIMTDLDAMDRNDEKSCKLFLDHYGKSNLLHPNHFILTEVRLSLAQLYGQKTEKGIQEIPDADLEHKTELCKQVLKLARQLFVAEWRVQGALLFELHAAVAERCRRDADAGLLDQAALISRLMESRYYLEEALKMLKNEPEALPEGKISIQCQINLTELDSLLQRIRHSMGECPI
nr:PREDICTED: protein msta-like [Bemisia tabaci]